MGCVCWQIHGSALETVSVTISEVAATQFSLTLFVSTGGAYTDEYMRHL
jgi:hypothetical protein